MPFYGACMIYPVAGWADYPWCGFEAGGARAGADSVWCGLLTGCDRRTQLAGLGRHCLGYPDL